MNQTSNRTTAHRLVGEHHSCRDISEIFTLLQAFSSGNTCQVWEAIRNKDGRRFAMKRLRKSAKWSHLLFESETTMLGHLNHPGIVGLEAVYEDDDFFYIATKLGKTDLFGAIADEGRMSEHRARPIIRKILETLVYMHDLEIVHRDLKPENIIFSSDLEQPLFIDFADAIRVEKDKRYTEFVGTTCYMSPERLRDHTGYELKLSDVWATGVMAYEMVTAKRCFYGNNDSHLIGKIQEGVWHWPKDQSDSFSPGFKDLIEHLLQVNPRSRYSAEEALMHPWFSNTMSMDDVVADCLGEDYSSFLVGNYSPTTIMAWMKHVFEDGPGFQKTYG